MPDNSRRQIGRRVAGIDVEAAKGLEFHAQGLAGPRGLELGRWWPRRRDGFQALPEPDLPDSVEPKSRDAARTQGASCPSGMQQRKKTTARAMVQKYDPGFDDGKWHKITSR